MHRKQDGKPTIAMLTVRNLSDEVHRALRVRVALKSRSAEAEVRAILTETVLPEGRASLGTLLTAVGRRAKLTDEEFADLARRAAAPARPIDLR
ncbi:MAG: plasmid stabilization protein [Albidovulum sp.]|nr:plasmid stabilization protein [Albidovulum sp.]